MKIITGKERIPWSWAFVILIPWFAFIVREQISNAGIVFTLKKFTDDPAIIGLIGSSNQAFGFLVGSICSFMSDRIWTPWGRRRPFLLVGFFSSAALGILIPQMGSFVLVVVVILSYQLVVDFTTPFEPLTMEVIPPKQRGRAGIITHTLKALAFGLVLAGLIGGFDNQYQVPLVGSVTGEQVMYWTNAVLLICMGFGILFLVEERKPKDATIYPIHKVPLWTFFREIGHRQMLPLLGLAFVMQSLWLGIAQFESLLVTEQWGYSKAEYGTIMSISLILTILFVPIGGFLSDRVDRMKLLKAGLFLAFGVKIFYYVYAEFIAPGGVPSYQMVVLLGLFKGGVGSMMAVACVPLIFDFVDSNRLGTLSAAMGITFSVVSFLNVNLMGVWIRFSAQPIFGLPEGRFNYMAGYHVLLLLMILGIGYFYLFAHLVKTGYIKKVH